MRVVMFGAVIFLSLFDGSGAIAQVGSDCQTPDPTRMLGVGRAFREAGVALQVPDAAAAPKVGFDKALVAALPNTVRLDSETGAVAVGEAAQVLVSALAKWAPGVDEETITRTLDTSPPTTGFIATDTLLLPTLQTLNTAFATLPGDQANAFGEVLNPAIAGINPQLAVALCQQFGMPMEMPFAVAPGDFAGILSQTRQFLADKLSGAPVPPQLTTGEILSLDAAPTLNKLLLGEGSLFRGELGGQYSSALANPSVMSEALGGARGPLFSPISLEAQAPSPEDLAKGLSETSLSDGQATVGQGGSIGDAHLKDAAKSCIDCAVGAATSVAVGTAVGAVAGAAKGGGFAGAIVWGAPASLPARSPRGWLA